MVRIHSLLSGVLRRKDRGATTADCKLMVALSAAATVTAVPSSGTHRSTVFHIVASTA
jgi:hypothetical protein